MTMERLRWIAAGAAMAAALGIYTQGFLNEPRLQDGDALQRAYARQVIRQAIKSQTTDLSRETALSDAYWRRYSDVAADPVVGRNGALGVYGAREHYDRHGRREQRIWGVAPQ